MGNSRKFASLQEEVVYSLSEELLGKNFVFLPNHFGNSKEPADVAWVANRCAILMYMTHSSKSLEKKIDHNLSQFRKWMRIWKAGQPLTGTFETKDHKYNYEDIDHVVGLSVVGGGDVGCTYHWDTVLDQNYEKISSCATITESVLKEMLNIKAYPRDLVSLLGVVSKSNDIIKPLELIKLIRSWASTSRNSIASEFSKLKLSRSNMRQAAKEMEALFKYIKNRGHESKELSDIFIDLNFSEMDWIAYSGWAAECTLFSQEDFSEVKLRGGNELYEFYYSAFRTSKSARDCIGDLITQKTGFSIITCFDMGRDCPLRTITLTPRQGQSLLEMELERLKGSKI